MRLKIKNLKTKEIKGKNPWNIILVETHTNVGD